MHPIARLALYWLLLTGCATANHYRWRSNEVARYEYEPATFRRQSGRLEVRQEREGPGLYTDSGVIHCQVGYVRVWQSRTASWGEASTSLRLDSFALLFFRNGLLSGELLRQGLNRRQWRIDRSGAKTETKTALRWPEFEMHELGIRPGREHRLLLSVHVMPKGPGTEGNLTVYIGTFTIRGGSDPDLQRLTEWLPSATLEDVRLTGYEI